MTGIGFYVEWRGGTPEKPGKYLICCETGSVEIGYFKGCIPIEHANCLEKVIYKHLKLIPQWSGIEAYSPEGPGVSFFHRNSPPVLWASLPERVELFEGDQWNTSV